MPPAARLSLAINKARLPSISIAPARFRVQGWDPLLIVSQIVSLQCLHYLTLALVMPILLHVLASSSLLAYEGGGSSVTMVMDWREFSGQPTASLTAKPDLLPGLVGLAAAMTHRSPAGTGPGGVIQQADVARGLLRVLEPDPMRGWAVALGWSLASAVDVFWLYHLIRRPTHILDFALTLVFAHLILTTYFSGSVPSSFFFWFVIGSCTVAQIVIAEQMCISREMREGFAIDTNATNTPMPPLPPLTPDTRRSPLPPGTPAPGSSATAAAAAAAAAVGRLSPAPGTSGSSSGTRGKEDVELSKFKSSPNLMVAGSSGGGNKYERLPTEER